jgi:hypothetical protein
LAIINALNSGFKLISFAATLATSVGCFTFSKLAGLRASFFRKNPPVLNSESAWHQNLALMQEAQSKTEDLQLKNRIRFLAVNYLNKVAPIMPSTARVMGWIFFESAFQISPYSLYQYHRASFRFRPDIGSTINQRFALGNNSPLVLTDTGQFAHFLPLKFIVLNRENREEWSALILKAMKRKTELLFDFTQDFGDTILTEGDKERENSFRAHFDQLKAEINAEIEIMQDKALTKEFLEQNSVAISRVRFECRDEWIGGMKVLPLFLNLSPKNVVKAHATLLHHFVEETGVILGALRLRRLVPDAFPLTGASAKSTASFLENYFESKEEFIELIDFKSLEVHSDKPHVTVLGKSFLDMLRGLLSKLDQDTWEEINQNSATRTILQAVLYRIINHLKAAEAAIEEDNQFIQAIELAHAELATLLELSLPYMPEDFSAIYLKQLEIIPHKLWPFIKAGLGKTAETVFAEVNVAVKAQNPNSVSAWCDWFYYEHMQLLGNNQKLKSVLQDEGIDHIDLYGCTFNPSIESDYLNTNYVQHNLIADIERILQEKPNTEHLSVAIDCTNDYVNSEKLQQLLNHFEAQICEGRLNIVVFGSGQKFDMLGMDHFYGSPFYVINNGADQWKPFDKLFTEEVHTTDKLSAQWFCLLYEFAPKSVDEFRFLFFANNRHVLENIPEQLSPTNKRSITVSKADAKAELTFIDIKVKGLFHRVVASVLVGVSQLYAVKNKVKASIRGSFGFLHPNATLIFSSNSTTLRLHAGILQSDNRYIIEFLHSLA